MRIVRIAALAITLAGLGFGAVADRANARMLDIPPTIRPAMNPDGAPACTLARQGYCWVDPGSGARYQCLCGWEGQYIRCRYHFIGY